MEIFFVCFFQTVLTNFRVHFVAFDGLVVFPLLCIHGADIAQNVRSQIGVVFSDGSSLNVHAGNAQLRDIREGHVVNVGEEYIVTHGLHAVAQGHFVAQADNGAGLFVGPLCGELVNIAQLFNQQRCGNIRVQVTDVGKIGLEITLPDVALLFQGVGKGSLGGDGEMFGVFNALFLAQLYQVVKMLIGVFCIQHHVVVQHQVVTGTVTYQQITVPVQNIAAGGFDTGQGGKGGGVVGAALSFNNLNVIQIHSHQAYDQNENQQKNTGTKTAYSFHVSPPIDAIDRIMG